MHTGTGLHNLLCLGIVHEADLVGEGPCCVDDALLPRGGEGGDVLFSISVIIPVGFYLGLDLKRLARQLVLEMGTSANLLSGLLILDLDDAANADMVGDDGALHTRSTF